MHGRHEGSADPVLFKIPVGSRPLRELRFQVAREFGVGSVVVGIDGAVTVDPTLGDGWTSLDTIRYIID